MEMITEELKTLLYHINVITFRRKLPYKVNVNWDIINKIKTEEIEISYNYLLITEDKDPSIIVTRSIVVPYDQYLDEKDKIIKAINSMLYEDILIYTQFEPEQNNINEIYKWN